MLREAFFLKLSLLLNFIRQLKSCLAAIILKLKRNGLIFNWLTQQILISGLMYKIQDMYAYMRHSLKN